MLARTPTPADASHMRGTKQHSGGVLPTLPTARHMRGNKQHAGGVLPTARLLPTTRGVKQHSGDAVLPLAGRSLLNLLRGLLR